MKKIKINSIKLISTVSDVESIKVPEGLSLNYFDDKVILENSMYEKLFEKTYKEFNYLPHKRGLVKIRKNGKSIIRIFYGGSSLGIKTGECALSAVNKQIIDDSSESSIFIKGYNYLNPFAHLSFYWNHPNNYVRVPFKIALLSILISITSLIITFF